LEYTYIQGHLVRKKRFQKMIPWSRNSHKDGPNATRPVGQLPRRSVLPREDAG